MGLNEHAKRVERLRTHIRGKIIKGGYNNTGGLLNLDLGQNSLKEVDEEVGEDEEGLKGDTPTQIIIKLSDVLTGVFLDLCIGIAFSLIVFIVELLINYYHNKHFVKDGFDLKPLNSHKFESMNFEGKGFETILVKFHKKKDLKNRRNREHRFLQDNYNIYFG